MGYSTVAQHEIGGLQKRSFDNADPWLYFDHEPNLLCIDVLRSHTHHHDRLSVPCEACIVMDVEHERGWVDTTRTEPKPDEVVNRLYSCTSPQPLEP
ncbi:hypothetical protein [Acidovorax sp. SDU_ACID1]|uniref:hypothetical protein n=1 Tax=Acidovorax sp. SDU_ACID1 TaxID=3136632 RepID=UPI003873BA09